MDRKTRREIVATLVKQGRRDLAERFVGAASAIKWEKSDHPDKGTVYIGKVTLKLLDAVGKPRKMVTVLRIDPRDGTHRIDYLGMLGHVWEAIDGGRGKRTLKEAKDHAKRWVAAVEAAGEISAVDPAKL